MDRIVRTAPYLAVALVVASCAGVSAPVATPKVSPSVVASPVATEPTASPSAVAAPTPSGSPTAFTSKTYGYSLTVPAGWTTIQASIPWDGEGMPSHDVPEADQFVSPSSPSASFHGAPTTKDLAGQVKQAIAGIAVDHGDTCPPVPKSQEPISVGSEPGVLLNYDCGILITNAITIHDGVAYVFGFRDPAVHAATDAADRATFLALLESVKFPR